MKYFALFTILFAAPLTAAPTLEIVRDGAPAATVVVAENASEQVRSAARLLVEYVEQSTGAALPLAQAPTAGTVTILVGNSPQVEALGLAAGEPVGDGFDITFPAENTIVILGRSDWGTEFGVYEFLERYVGVRWLMPGSSGTDVPHQRTIIVPTEPVSQDPVFFSREMSGFRGADQVQWARRNRMHRHVSFHHNLRNLFPWEKYAETHPQYYPMLADGTRYVPTHEEGWQPCFTTPGMVEEAIKNITEYFDKNPDVTSYSLGINDNRNFCQCPDCRAQMSGEQNFLGMPDYSDLYYEWCNKVVEAVLEKHPDKYFGLLAYNNVAAPPQNVQVHPRLIPYMTYDRMKWIHPELRREGEEATRQWQEKSPTLGWYDYIYGRPYMLPRVWFHHMADYYRFGHENGVQVQYAEAYPNWGEGPKLYISFKLQWDPYQDVDALLDEWYVRTAGEASAPYLKRYYAFWEDFWTRRILDSSWFRLPGQWLPHRGNPTYLLDVSEEELAQCREWMEQALANVETDEQRDRMEILFTAFEFYEASALVYQASRPLEITTGQEALSHLNRAIRALEMVEKRHHLATEVFPEHPVLLNVSEALLFENDRGLVDLLWAVYAWTAANEDRAAEVMRRFRELPDRYAETPIGELAALLISIHENPDRLVERVQNGSFEEDGGPAAEAAPDLDWTSDTMPPPWSKWIRPATTARVEWTAEQAHSGRRSIKISEATAASVLQRVDVNPGETYLVSVYVNADISLRSYARMRVQWQDAAGWLSGVASTDIEIRHGASDGWVQYSTFFRIPEGATIAVIGLSAGEQEEGDYIFFDTVSVRQLVAE